MSDPSIFRLPMGATGALGLMVVDKAAVGYLDAWQAPAGKVLPTVVLADYTESDESWVCQVTSAALTPTSNVTTTPRAATMCAPAAETVVPAEDTFVLDLTLFQDAHMSTGLQAYLYANRTKEAYVYFGADADAAPRMIGRVTLTSTAIGGAAATDLDTTVSFTLSRAPDIEFGQGATTAIVTGAGSGGGALMAAQPAPAATAPSSYGSEAAA